MSLAVISLIGLVIAIILSCTSKINVGILAIGLAFIIGVYFAGLPAQRHRRRFSDAAVPHPRRRDDDVHAGQGQRHARQDRPSLGEALQGQRPLVPIMFFFLAFALGAIGPGSTASAALTGPIAMAVAAQMGIPAFLMAIMVANGSSAGSLSPIAPTGIIVNGHYGQDGHDGPAVAELLHRVRRAHHRGFVGYFIFGGWTILPEVYSRQLSGVELVVAVSPAAAGFPTATSWSRICRSIAEQLGHDRRDLRADHRS